MADYHENHVWGYQAVLKAVTAMRIGVPNNLETAAVKAYFNPLNFPLGLPLSISQGTALTLQGLFANEILKSARKEDDAFMGELMKAPQYTGNARKELWLAEIARHAIQTGVGKCAEMAAISFMFLRDQGRFPLDYVFWGNVAGGFGGHTFAILGRPGDSDIEDPNTWGRDCAIVDPHKEQLAFPAYMVDHYFGSKKFELYLRLEGPTDSTKAIPE